jgi:hypothetical protein
MGQKIKWQNEDVTNMMFLRPLHYGNKSVEIIIFTEYEAGIANKETAPSR